ncbi:MAG: hypothetical protein U0Q16_17550 [Bryobacteraceae bacterium]
MAEAFPYDRVVKDIFLHDRPALIGEVTGGRQVVEFTNVELPKTIERRADLLMRLDDGEVHHLEFQATNLYRLPYRQGVICFLLAGRHRRQVIGQTVIYLGEAPMRMRSGIDVGAGSCHYRLIDIRECNGSRSFPVNFSNCLPLSS